ncbi:Unannotated [Lentimonas sp. CC19]|nr:Unannotated [Lentimonas sp. CC4]CAA6685988.1 Unannotated [Lentimonas sp. CC6]CAA6691808.1 Unannotated [Lentimonas sp. CC19]CAA6694556.1 Unannotated [Lentimonas sp. CC10]CAA7072097.1 Unannotated [Lentimonas sp. CC11]CAA7168650.1 Unannotated [Lentimonas sp. CC21]CAA7181042.1 Unannotated [Lentimonas sp. CC8]
MRKHCFKLQLTLEPPSIETSLIRMDLSTYQTMDPHLLVGVVNTTIRNHCESLDDLCKTHDLDAEILTTRLAEAGYDYMPEQRQFR